MICPFEKNMEAPGAVGHIRNLLMTISIYEIPWSLGLIWNLFMLVDNDAKSPVESGNLAHQGHP